jgi:hypothetical protein
MAITRKKATVSTEREKLTVKNRLGVIHITSVVKRANSNGIEYIPTPFGAVYARLDEVKPGLHKVVELSNGAIALNNPTKDDVMEFINDKLTQYPNLTASEIKAEYGL